MNFPRYLCFPLFVAALLCPLEELHAQTVVTEKIIYAVNEDYAQYNPNWESAAQEIVEFTNQVLAQNTSKRYEIVEFKTFSYADWHEVGRNKEYAHDNGYGGTTVFHWVELPSSPFPLGELLANVASLTHIDGVLYHQLYLIENHPQHSVLLGRNAATNFDGWMQVFLHEIGHTMGLSVPDWYFYEFDDLSGVAPNLPYFNLRALYPSDPMSSWVESGYRFSDFNAAIINRNLKHEKTYLEIQWIASSTIEVIVRDQLGNPLPDATVRVYGVKKGCYYCQDVTNNPLLLLTTTSSAGKVNIPAPSVAWELSEGPDTPYIALSVKTAKGDTMGGAYVIAQQMQQHKFLTEEDVFPLSITNQHTSTGWGGVDVSVGGSWWNPNRNGEGFVFDFFTIGQRTGVVVYYYTYDLNDNPIFLVGSADVILHDINPIVVDVVKTEGTSFGHEFNSDDVVRQNWGTLTIEFFDCENARVTWASVIAGYGSGTTDIVRLVPLGTGITCP